jgi:hypothetical protein
MAGMKQLSTYRNAAKSVDPIRKQKCIGDQNGSHRSEDEALLEGRGRVYLNASLGIDMVQASSREQR